ncbi:Dihydrolipoamide dehydrogenase of pyruvate dehydrogenase complex [hydrothermal vent metagenome]|uniref:dihydrolipoyl dehydrogenase n=1 Tax=hydrothermal vent metagenome TaxID=652676 RepID=A0A3B1DCV6_9ZZZZ
MTVEKKIELLVLGGGPGGYPAAFEAADRGMNVALVDDAPLPGGVCLHRGCIPSKTLLHAAKLIHEARDANAIGISFGEPKIDLDKIRSFKNGVIEQLTGGIAGLAKRRGVELINGRGTFISSTQIEVTNAEGDSEIISFEKAMIATGSSPVMPSLFDIGDTRVMDSTGALMLEDVPKKLLVIGGGYIGLEMGSVYSALGADVTVVEMTSTLLPGADRDLVGPLKRKLTEQFAAIHLKTKVLGLTATKNGIIAELEGDEVEPQQTFDRVLVAVGRSPNSQQIGLEKTSVELDDRGFVKINNKLQTADEHFFAIGDVAGEPMLAHKATRQGRVAVEVIAGEDVLFSPKSIPAVVFTDPEIAWCGMTETEAKLKKIKLKASRFPWAASGRAQSLGRTEGITKVLADPETGSIVGVGIVGPGAGELIAEGVLAIEQGLKAKDLAAAIHAHPTLSETMMESAEGIFGQATHIYRPPRK